MYNSNVVIPTVFHNAFKRIRLSEDVVRKGDIFGLLRHFKLYFYKKLV